MSAITATSDSENFTLFIYSDPLPSWTHLPELPRPERTFTTMRALYARVSELSRGNVYLTCVCILPNTDDYWGSGHHTAAGNVL
jgi:hypothetical protein